MVNIQIQESEAFDRLGIIEVKIFNTNDLQTKTELNRQKLDLMAEINKSIGYDKARAVYSSKEYTDLYNVNFELFDAVDKAKKDEVTASFVDELVYERHLAKKNLQNKHFGNEFKEIKLGYKNE
jgi:hypothetical protein